MLASEVQVGKPADTEDDPDEDEVRFALTSEAGLNDGLAFPPFVYLAILISLVGASPPEAWLGEWLALDVLWRIGVGGAARLRNRQASEPDLLRRQG